MNLTKKQKKQIIKILEREGININSIKEFVFIEKENEVQTCREFNMYHPFLSLNKAINNGYAIPFVPIQL
jgi:hypothetical protein